MAAKATRETHSACTIKERAGTNTAVRLHSGGPMKPPGVGRLERHFEKGLKMHRLEVVHGGVPVHRVSQVTAEVMTLRLHSEKS